MPLRKCPMTSLVRWPLPPYSLTPSYPVSCGGRNYRQFGHTWSPELSPAADRAVARAALLTDEVLTKYSTPALPRQQCGHETVSTPIMPMSGLVHQNWSRRVPTPTSLQMHRTMKLEKCSAPTPNPLMWARNLQCRHPKQPWPSERPPVCFALSVT